MADSVLRRNLLLGDSRDRKTFIMDLKAAAGPVVEGMPAGYLTATKSVTPFDSGGSGGEELFFGIFAEDKDPIAGDTTTLVYIKGEFGLQGLVFGTTADQSLISDQDFKNSARDKGIILKTVQRADPL